MSYFSDRETGEVPRTTTELTPSAWRGIAALIQVRLDDGSFGERYPEICPDGAGAYGTNDDAACVMPIEWVEQVVTTCKKIFDIAGS